MYMYFTTGTRDFMEKLQARHADKGMILMHGGGQSLLLHETDGKKSAFQTPRRYEVVSSAGSLKEEGFFVYNNIPVTDEGRPIFEHRFSTDTGRIESQKGFTAYRLLRPLDSDTYIVMTEWEDAADYDRWKHSRDFKESPQSLDMNAFAGNTTHIFDSASYITTYIAKIDDKE